MRARGSTYEEHNNRKARSPRVVLLNKSDTNLGFPKVSRNFEITDEDYNHLRPLFERFSEDKAGEITIVYRLTDNETANLEKISFGNH